jgi:hypothetical protein
MRCKVAYGWISDLRTCQQLVEEMGSFGTHDERLRAAAFNNPNARNPLAGNIYLVVFAPVIEPVFGDPNSIPLDREGVRTERLRVALEPDYRVAGHLHLSCESRATYAAA